jgi:hypothetical protein
MKITDDKTVADILKREIIMSEKEDHCGNDRSFDPEEPSSGRDLQRPLTNEKTQGWR